MKKTRMSIDDIHAMVGSIRANVQNMRVTNIYDVQGQGESGAAKTYILKLHQPPFPKVFLLLESGVRFHTSKYARDAKAGSALPSQFTMKLRKHLRGKRLSGLRQLEGDRVVDLTLGQDALQCHLILELYAAGNIILTDGDYRILSLLRTHRFDENVTMAVKQVYPVQLLGDQEKQRGLQTPAQLVAFVDKWFEEQEAKAAVALPGKAQKKKKALTIKQLLLVKDSTFGGLGPVIIEHCLVRAGISATLKLKTAADFTALGDDKLAALLAEIQEGWKLLERLQSEQTSVNGPVPVQSDDAADAGDSDEDDAAPVTKMPSASSQKCGFIILKESTDENAPEQFEEFTPFLYAQHQQAHKKAKSFDTFDEAVDEYFSRFEAETAEVAKQSAQLAAENQLAKLKKNQQQQLAQLREVQELSFQHAQLIEANQQDVENVLLVIRSALASGMDWRGLEELVRYEQKNGNPVASFIHKLDLEHNRVAILLCDDEDEDEGEDGGDGTGEEDKQAHVIWIDLSLSALANAREIYTKKKKAGEKVKKATEATDKAIAVAEKNTKKTLEKQQTKRNVIYQRRKTHWFEKFHWFLTNEKYLVVAGKDAHQNELLVKRYLRKGDVYVHADLHGAATCIVRNHATVKDKKTQELPLIPVATLEQAGCMSVCRSNAWTSQVIAGAYWVHADQVSKTAPAGEYLTTGSFMIRGKKNYIQPSRLEMGLAIIFRIDESCISNHARQGDGRTQRAAKDFKEEDGDDDDDQDTPDVEETQQGEQGQEPVDDAVKVENAPKQRGTEKPEVAEREEDEDEEAEEEAPSQQPLRDGKKRLSAKERRDMKKGKLPLREDSTDEQPPALQKQVKGKDKGKDKDNSSASAPQQKKNVRGKKGKMKKMKKKYADQDDEDRRLRMEALGHVVEEDQEEEEQSKDGDDSTEQSGGENGEAADTTSKAEVSEEYIRQQREKKDKFLDEQEDEAEGADFFDAFTGEPLADDIVLFAMPMCAPYASLTKFKYKVKLTPGSQKKGKAAKQAMEHFFASNFKDEKDANKSAPYRAGDDAEDEVQPGVNPIVVQRELMRCIPETELVNCMVGPVKISAPGLHGPNAGGKKGGGKRPSGKPKKKGKKA
ncbi:Nuclear export mediator factor [Phytophthora fragariae]|uniref:Ribosome quality control complex subunit 2 n=1 Tax=Phytophthora fragariae TaxID=53985 RepID=A0A6G0S6U2_9STRA|nr:Nuclear export mediator factor [Phytophthora fragariae]